MEHSIEIYVLRYFWLYRTSVTLSKNIDLTIVATACYKPNIGHPTLPCIAEDLGRAAVVSEPTQVSASLASASELVVVVEGLHLFGHHLLCSGTGIDLPLCSRVHEEILNASCVFSAIFGCTCIAAQTSYAHRMSSNGTFFVSGCLFCPVMAHNSFWMFGFTGVWLSLSVLRSSFVYSKKKL